MFVLLVAPGAGDELQVSSEKICAKSYHFIFRA
jgi:hypothetical protein